MYRIRTWDGVEHEPKPSIEAALQYARDYLWRTCGRRPSQIIYDAGRIEADGTEVHQMVMCEDDSDHKLPFYAEVYPDPESGS